MTRRALVSAAALVFFFAWFLFLRPGFLGGPASYIVVTGVSMQPTLFAGDLVVVQRQDRYSVGDVVVYGTSQGNVIHRIRGGTATEGFVTRGDNKTDDDPWNPTPDQILGKMWLHIPGAGRALVYLRQPLQAGLLVGGLALLSLAGGGKVTGRRKRGARMTSGTTGSSSRRPLGPTWALATLGISVVLAVGLGALAGFGFRNPAEKPEQVERLRYEHTGSFGYTVRMAPSTLYPDGIVGPVRAPSDPSTKTPPPALYTKLARGLDLDFAYILKSSLPPQVSGEIGGALEIKAGENGWSKQLELLPATPFSGSGTFARITVDLAQIWSLVDAVEKETGYTPGVYDVVITPTVHLKGQIGSQPIDESYAPTFTMKLSRTQITLDDQLARSDVKKLTDTVDREQRIGLGDLSLPVPVARWVGLGGSILFLAAAGFLAAFLFLGLGRDEAAKIQARYGALMIPVAGIDLKETVQIIRLASMEDLGRLAQRDGQTIFHQGGGAEPETFFVHHGDVVYIYRKPESVKEG